jgi:GNAT superfamily N-acetyltransferase
MADAAVRVLDPAEYPLWDDLVARSPQGTVFHTGDWVGTMAGLLNRTPRIYGYWSDGDLIGGCSLYLHPFAGLYTSASSVCAMTPYGGMVIAKISEAERHTAIDALAAAIEAERFAQVRLKQPPEFDDIRPLVWRGWQAGISYTYHVALDDVTLSRNCRRNIRKAEQQGVTVLQSDDFDAFFPLFLDTFSHQGMQCPLSRGAAADLYAMLRERDRGEMWAAITENGQMAAADIYVRDPRRVYRWSAVAHPDLRNLGAAFLLLSTAFAEFGQRGYPTMDIMTANVAHLAEFSRNFSPKLVPYYEIRRTALRKKIAGIVLRES